MKQHVKHYNFHMADRANQHTHDMYRMYEDEIRSSIENSRIYRSCSDHSNGETTDIVFECMTTTDAIMAYAGNGKVCALNYASFRHPGGGFLRGSVAQEETLCHDSYLFNVIDASTFAPEYQSNYERQNKGMYENFAIYSPDIRFIIGGKKTATVDIMTCASPNYKEGIKNGVSFEENHKAYIERLEFICNIAVEQKVDTFILGAWGCGVFQQNSGTVAADMKEVLKKYHFNKVVIAIPTIDKLNIFKRIMQ